MYAARRNGISDKDAGTGICLPDGLASVTKVTLGPIQVGHDPAFGQSTTVAGTAANKYGVVLDDVTTGVAALVASQPSAAAGTVTADRTATEAALKAALVAAGATVTDVFIGRQFNTHETLPAVTSTFRVTKAGTSSSLLRDAIVKTITGGNAPGGATAGGGSAFYLDVTTVHRGTQQDNIVVFSPTNSYDDPALQTSIRVSDLVNASGVSQQGKDLDFECQGVLTGNAGKADIIWTVDISLSMDGNQVRLAQTAEASGFETVYVGGGTPSHIGLARLSMLLYTLSLSMQGRALESGAAGDEIRILNTATSRTVRGTVLASGHTPSSSPSALPDPVVKTTSPGDIPVSAATAARPASSTGAAASAAT